jgi:hypothetical protein
LSDRNWQQQQRWIYRWWLQTRTISVKMLVRRSLFEIAYLCGRRIMGTGTTGRNTKAVKLARCSICREIPKPDCDWQQGRCPHREPAISSAVIRNFINFFKKVK